MLYIPREVYVPRDYQTMSSRRVLYSELQKPFSLAPERVRFDGLGSKVGEPSKLTQSSVL